MAIKLEGQIENQEAESFWQAVACLETPDEVKRFLRDVLTLEEINEAVRRFDVARRLYEGETFKNIEEATKVSSTTISRVNHWLHHGKRGYKLVLERMGIKPDEPKDSVTKQ